MRIISLFITVFGILLVFSSCHKSTNPVEPTGTGNSGKDTGSYGNATMKFNDSVKFTTTNNFFLYDSSDHTFRLQMIKDSTFGVVLVLNMPQLRTGTFAYPPDSGIMTINGYWQLRNTIIPYQDTVYITISKMDLVNNIFSAILFVHLGAPVGIVRKIDSLTITDAGFAIIPVSPHPSFSAKIGGIDYPGPSAAILTSYTAIGGGAMMTSEIGMQGQAGNSQLQLTFTPTKEVLGNYDLATSVTRLYYYKRIKDPNHFGTVDSVYHSWFAPGTLAITKYDKSRRIISGTFNGTIENDITHTQYQVTDGVFNNVALEIQ